MVPLSCAGVRVRGGVAASMAGRFAAFCRELAATGYKIKFVGGYRPGTCATASRHPCGGAIDINQHSRNVCEGGCPRSHINAMARRHGLLHGAEWRHADAGHFERLDRHSLAKIERGHTPLLAWSERPKPETKPPVQLASVDPSDPLHEDIAPPPQIPEPDSVNDRVGIFRRYIESREVVVMAHTSLNCGKGQTFPGGLRLMLDEAAAHFGKPVRVNSGYRTAERNRRVGGARNSQHMKCKAVDFRVVGVSIGDLRRYVMNNLKRFGVGAVGTYGSHLHADVRKATRLVTWTGGAKKRLTRYAKHRKPGRYAAAG